MPTTSKTVAIIGAGVAGIASAIRLAQKGYKAKVFEANPYPGGKLAEFYLNGFRFDAGPSLFTMPQLVDELFLLTGRNPQDYFQYEKLDITCKYFYEDGTIITAYSDKEQFEKEVLSKTPEKEGAIIRALETAKGFTNSSQGCSCIEAYINGKRM